MALALPKHTVDGPAVLVLPDDDAWDVATIERERAELGEGETHPWDAYQQGETRYDFSQVEKYIVPSKTPVRWHLRRLAIDEWLTIQSVLGADVTVAAYRALQLALVDVDGIDFRLEGGDLARKGLTKRDLDELDKRYRWYLLVVGHAAIKLSRGLTEGERKASGSSRGHTR